MKILFILHYPPPVHGSTVVGSFVKESSMLNSSVKSYFINLGTSLSVDDIGRNSIKKILRYISLIRQVLVRLLVQKPDLCYFTPTSSGPGFYKDALIIAIVKMYRVLSIYHFHNKGVSTRQDRFFDNLLYRMVFRKAYVILLSKHLYPDLKKYVPENRVFYCPNGIPDIKDVNRAAICKESGAQSFEQSGVNEMKKMKFEASCTTFVEILFLSHLFESKGVFVLVDALKIIKERGSEFHCTMIGGEGDVSHCQMKNRIKEANLDDYVDIVRQKYGEEKLSAYAKADIFVHPTYNDCLPLVLLEAMQHSIPIVSTPEGAIPDVVEDGVTGFLVPQRNVSLLADKIEVLIQEPDLRKKMGIAGRAKYEEQFTLEKFERRFVEILNEIGNVVK